MSRPIVPALVAALAVTALTPAAFAQRFRPQNNEVQFDLDATFMEPNNASEISVSYTWLPGGYNARDEVVPALRRFVRQPLELFVRGLRTTDTFDNVTGVSVGARWAPLGGRLYGLAELGADYDSIENDPFEQENAFVGGSARLEVGGRLLPLLQLGGAYRVRGVLRALAEPIAGGRADRGGATQEADAVVTFSTPDDRLLLSAAVGWRDVEWTYRSSTAPGEVTGSGPHAWLRGSFQLNVETSVLFRARYAREDWENTRPAPFVESFLVVDPARTVSLAEVELGLLYWFEARWGFRVSLGGGYSDGPPLVDARDTARFKAGVGFVSRY